MSTLPPLRKKYFEHGLIHNEESQRALKNMARSVKALREKNKFTQSHLASLAGCSRQLMQHIEHGHHFPSLPVYLALCRVLGEPKPPLV